MTVTVIWLGSPSTIPAGGPEASDDPVSDSAQADLRAIRDDIAELRKSVDALREALLQRSTPPDFSPVSIRVESPDGRPLPGFAVGLNSTGSEARRVTATGESDAEGLALSRDMPYGQYTLWVRHPAGWSTAFRKVTVEIGKPLEQIVIAPDPDERAALQIRSSLDQRAFAGLRFGQRRDYTTTPGASYAVPSVPEPGLEDSQFPRFPTLGAGILQAAARIEIAIEQEIRQPGGDLQTWHWRLGEQAFPKALLAATGLVISIADYEEGVHRPDVSARYFRPQEPPALPTRRSDFAVGYLVMQPAEHGQPVFGADIPPDVRPFR